MKQLKHYYKNHADIKDVYLVAILFILGMFIWQDVADETVNQVLLSGGYACVAYALFIFVRADYLWHRNRRYPDILNPKKGTTYGNRKR